MVNELATKQPHQIKSRLSTVVFIVIFLFCHIKSSISFCTNHVAIENKSCLTGSIGGSRSNNDNAVLSPNDSSNGYETNFEKAAKTTAPPSTKITIPQRRRHFLSSATKIAAATTNTALLFPPPPTNSLAANAFPFGGDERRQLEFCLVTTVRTQYWATSVSNSLSSRLSSTPSDSTSASLPPQPPYIEARLGAKALLTGRVPSGANENVYRLATLQLRGCLKDAVATCPALSNNKYKKFTSDENVCSRREAENLAEDVVESLAACLEFDGLDNLQDPSPRSSLMLSAYKKEKGLFVVRMLRERTVPSCRDFGRCFGGEALRRAEEYVRVNYPSEVPMSVVMASYGVVSD